MLLAALDQKLSILDKLPETLYSTVITNTHGELFTRVEGVLQWRTALLKGELPDEKVLVWPDAEMRRVVLKRLEVLEIVAYCREQEALTDSILKDICDGISSAEDFYNNTPGGFIDKLAQKQNIRDRDTPFDDPENLADHVENTGSGMQDYSADEQTETEQAEQQRNPEDSEENQHSHNSGEQKEATQNVQAHQAENDAIDQAGEEKESLLPVESDDGEQQVHQAESTSHYTNHDDEQSIEDNSDLSSVIGEQSNNDIRSIQDPAEHAADHLEKRWSELAESWHELSETFSELSGKLGKGWDLTQGVLASQGWRDIVRYRKLIKHLPELKALLKTLGRLNAISGDDALESVSEKVFNPMKRMVQDEDETMTPHVSMETGGIERSDEISRMLPSELALLGHSKLKILWHAKRAERMLMTYRYSGLMPDAIEIEDEQELEGSEVNAKSSLGAGPVIVCLDTSGSMEGEPEQLAKSLVLEALRLAWEEERECYIYSFGGPEEVIEHELDLTQGGIGKLLDFLQMSFHGGTDVTQPLLKALERQSTENWSEADILLISDGRFPAKLALFSKLKNMKQKQGLRIHGLLLGGWRGTAIEKICEPLHLFNDWQVFREVKEKYEI